MAISESRAPLGPPVVASGLVPRQRLVQTLDGVFAHRLTLLSAAAGWGKTTLLSVWASRYARQVAWHALDEFDNDPRTFWRAVVSVLRAVAPDIGVQALAMLNSAEAPPITAIIRILLADLEHTQVAGPLLLIMDDYHLIDDPVIHNAMAFLLDRLPPLLRVVLASRVDPDLPLARWRVRGELLELRATDLRFAPDEAAALLTHALGEPLASSEVQHLEQRTEGWAAGLRLAALALQPHPDRSAFVQAFAGSHRFLLDYVQQEILAQQPPAVQRFLLHTAVLRRLNASLAAALTDSPAAQFTLEQLERANLFVVPLDEGRQWYRTHDLVREVLLARLQMTTPDLVPELHRRAAQWCAAHGELREAMSHALAAGDGAFAADLIAAEAPRCWHHGEAHLVHAWVERLPEPALQTHGRLALDAALHLMETLQGAGNASYAEVRARVERTIARVEATLTPAQQAAPVGAPEDAPVERGTEQTLLARRIGLLRALLAARALVTRGDLAGMQRLADEATALAAAEEVRWQLVALNLSFWLTESLLRQGALLIPRLEAAKRRALAAGDDLAAVQVMRRLAFAHIRGGRLRQAHQECREALALVAQSGQHTAQVGYLHSFLGAVSYAWNRLDEAADAQREVLRIAQLWQQEDLQISGEAFGAQVALARGDAAAADAALRVAEVALQHEQFRTHRGFIAAARVQYWLAVGNVEAAGAWAQQVVFAPEHGDLNRLAEELALIRVYVAQGRHEAALAALEQFTPALDRPGDTATAVELLALQALALHGAGRWLEAHRAIVRLLGLTEPEGAVRLYLDAGAPMRRLLEELRDAVAAGASELSPAQVSFVSRLLALFWEDAPGSPQPERVPQPSTATPDPRAQGEPLTRREREVLRLLASGATNQEIADALVISLATAKKHVSNLLAKLQMANRNQIIAHARLWEDQGLSE